MASRMDRYNKTELVSAGRSSKNKSLYEQIENLENYSNIEGVATIEKTNEIDISKVQDMIKNREEYKKRRQLKDIIKEEEEKIEAVPEEVEETKSYDIKDLLSKMENGEKDGNKIRSLDKKQYEVLKSLKRENSYDIKKEEDEFKELVNTIHSTKMLKDLESDLDVGLFDDLKSDTMVGDASSIKKILDEEKETPKLEDTNAQIDREFYTSSFGFTKSDFEDLKNINQNIKKSNKFIIILLITVIALVVAIGLVIFLINK